MKPAQHFVNLNIAKYGRNEHAFIRACKEYAEQAIDRCEEVARKMAEEKYYDGREITIEIKSELK